MQALIIGGGVTGLTTATVLQEAGFEVVIWTRQPALQTTSRVAAAIWYPYRVYPPEKAAEWGKRSYQIFCELATQPGTGIVIRSGVQVSPEVLPEWAEYVPSLKSAQPQDMPLPGMTGYRLDLPVVAMDIYLPYLVERFLAAGGKIELKAVETLEEATAVCPLVINCSGLGARELAHDDDLYPVRGQVVRVSLPAVPRFFLDEEQGETVRYIIPRLNDCILGGVAQEGNWSEEVDTGLAQDIIASCAEIIPELAHAQILEHRVGLRPGRKAVRLEVEAQASAGLVIHNYGHGGGGVTLSWGCAEAVLELAKTSVKK